jgi:hypothetical protein
MRIEKYLSVSLLLTALFGAGCASGPVTTTQVPSISPEAVRVTTSSSEDVPTAVTDAEQDGVPDSVPASEPVPAPVIPRASVLVSTPNDADPAVNNTVKEVAPALIPTAASVPVPDPASESTPVPVVQEQQPVSVPEVVPSSIPVSSDPVPSTPAIEEPVVSNPPSAATCCKVCTKGKACGDTCISKSYTCHQPPGCACDAN